MLMKWSRGFLICICLLAYGSVQAQLLKLKKADELFEQYSFASAIELYEEVVVNKNDFHAKVKLAECYRLTNNPVNAEKYYAEVVEDERIDAIHILHYAQSLQSNNKCNEAKKWYRRFTFLEPLDDRGERLAASCENKSQFVNSTYSFEVLPLSINTHLAEFGPSFYKDGIVFSTARTTDKKAKQDGWTGSPFLNVYYAEGKHSMFKEPIPIPGEINTDLNEGPVAFTKHENTMFFTRNNDKKRKSKKNNPGTVHLNIYQATNHNGSWTDIEHLPFNNVEYTVAHPTVTANGKKLYFISDRPGGYGGSDIFVTVKNDSTWSKPKNLGPVINTEGNEMFPFIHNDGTLFFASDGHKGMGGLDVFYASQKDDEWHNVSNMGHPVNTSMDDFGFILNATKETGYFSSNRAEGSGDDDLYCATRVNSFLNGSVLDDNGNSPMSGVKIFIQDNLGKTTAARSGADGEFVFPVNPGSRYWITFNQEGFDLVEKEIQIPGMNPPPFTIRMKQIKLQEPVGSEGVEKGSVLFVLKDKSDGKLLTDCLITLKEKGSDSQVAYSTNDLGLANFKIKSEVEYLLAISKPGYFNYDDLFVNENPDTGLKKEVLMEKLAPGMSFVLEDLYYDLDQWFIGERAKPVLDKLVIILVDSPTMKIEVATHTDSKGDDAHNLELTQSRAEAVVNYLISNGISRDRLLPKGYGETKLLNNCSNQVECSEEAHRENIRTEYIIIEN